MPEEQRIAVPTEFDPEDEYRPEPEPEPQPPTWMDGSVRIGIHTSIAGSYLNALEAARRSEEHTSELQSPYDLVCRLLLEKKNRPVDAGAGREHLRASVGGVLYQL